MVNVRIKRDKQHKCSCDTNKLEKTQSGPSIHKNCTDMIHYQNAAGLYLDGR